MSRLMTSDDLMAIVAAGYHCEWRESPECEYRPAPHWVGGHPVCAKCKPYAEYEQLPEDPLVRVNREYRWRNAPPFPKYDFPEIQP